VGVWLPAPTAQPRRPPTAQPHPHLSPLDRSQLATQSAISESRVALPGQGSLGDQMAGIGEMVRCHVPLGGGGKRIFMNITPALL
jgi:hypothetical protein